MERIIGVVGRHIKNNLLEVDVDTTIVKVQGYVGRPSAAKQKNTEQYLFVNGRYFNSPRIYRAIMKAYEKLIPEKDAPSYFLYLTLNPERVDVNVSPHKTEVHFADADEVNQIVTAAVRSTLAKSGSVAMMDFDNNVAIDIPVLGTSSPAIYAEPKSTSLADYNPFREDYIDVGESVAEAKGAFDDPFELSQRSAVKPSVAPSSRSQREGKSDSLRDVSWSEIISGSDFSLSAMPAIQTRAEHVSEEYEEIESSFAEPVSSEIELDDTMRESTLEFIPSAMQSQIEYDSALEFTSVVPLAGGYAIAMSAGRMMVVDLKRAKERLLYDDYMAMLGAGSMASQRLLFSETLTLSEDDYQLLMEHEVEFAALGFDMSLHDDCRVELHGVPVSVVGEQADTLLYDLLHEVELQGDARERMRSDMARVMASRAARVDQNITSGEAQDMLDRLCNCENYSFTPSGRSIMAEITLEELKSKLN